MLLTPDDAQTELGVVTRNTARRAEALGGDRRRLPTQLLVYSHHDLLKQIAQSSHCVIHYENEITYLNTTIAC